MKKFLISIILVVASVVSIFFYKDNIVNLFKENKVLVKENHDVMLSCDSVIGVEQPFPFIVDDRGVEKNLNNLAYGDYTSQFIYLNKDKLPEAQKKLFVNNKDAQLYIVDYLTGNRVNFEYGETAELKRKYPYYLQWDRRWAYNELGGDSIAIGGCGPTCVAMALGGLLNDEKITPNKIAEIENKSGYYTPYGTSWEFFTYIGEKYGVNVSSLKPNKKNIDSALKRGNPLIVSVHPGKFTTVGHIILIVGKDAEGNYIINDPNSYTRTLKKWSYDELKTEMRTMWEYSK